MSRNVVKLAQLPFWAAIFLILISSRNASAAYTSASKYLSKPIDWFKTDQAAGIAANLLSYQADSGGFPKNIDTAAAPYTGDRANIESTFDNSATTDELRFLARMTAATRQPRYRSAFLKGLDYVLMAQYPNGGWPQDFPPDPKDYDRYITFNDGAMARLMFFIKEVANEPLYDFVDNSPRENCKRAWNKGIDCILKCQIKVDGKLTAWCQQHDEKDFKPRPARTFEPIALTPCESVGIIHVLMAEDHPSLQIIQAIDAAVAWMDAVKISGIRLEEHPEPNTPKGFQRLVVADPSAPPIWARYYEIGTNRPIFSGRDSVIKYNLSEIEIERRTGYNWYKNWPKNLIEKEYPAWKKKLASPSTTHP